MDEVLATHRSELFGNHLGEELAPTAPINEAAALQVGDARS